MAEKVLEIKNLTKKFPDGTVALNDISVSFEKGDLIAVIGPSGAGKSTFLRSINRLQEPTFGEILIEGKDILKTKGSSLRKLRRKVGMVFQGYNLIKRSSVLQNVLHGRLGYSSSIKGSLGMFSQQERKRALEVLIRMGLEEQTLKRADECSGGQQQRVGIARAMMQDPVILLADEPIASLDPASSARVMNYIKIMSQEQGITAIVNLHQVDYAKSFATRIIGIRAGEIMYDGPPHLLSEHIIKDLYQDQYAEEARAQ
ncbi:phosphonate ABC transporter ATP-binding protein [Planococcus sp. ISL-109]|uniref:phosphonate ABC transporter ATP-binding protein n=1 Tax=Planococcus sp. ISL-109 TaxID=2819166 RepID=UPI001BE63A68|nr:phosphonate ABC transporter ATP-binding protein [Planococcus sp. ISL-109]